MLVTTSEVFKNKINPLSFRKVLSLALITYSPVGNFFPSGILYSNPKKADLILLIYSRCFKRNWVMRDHNGIFSDGSFKPAGFFSPF